MEQNQIAHIQRIPTGRDIPVKELTIRHLKTASDIQEVQYLRQQINLTSLSLIDPEFLDHEKKEMN